eukprot:GHVP01034786.1.p1 GENE.GHVP01034786.1~~GHVP01034786.1.p1  ORF type:complete len:134 (-),score=5.44 GHVP01034786.1:42-443(-)
MADDNVKMLSEKKKRQPTRTCKGCGELNHFYAYCPIKTRRCYNCQEFGPIFSVCSTNVEKDRTSRVVARSGKMPPRRTNSIPNNRCLKLKTCLMALPTTTVDVINFWKNALGAPEVLFDRDTTVRQLTAEGNQ